MKLVDLKDKLLKKDLSKYDNLKLSKFEEILNANSFVHSHITILESNKGKKIFKPYYDRLLKFYTIVHTEN